MNRKQRRAEAFGHFSDSRKEYQPKDCPFPGIQLDITMAYEEMVEDVKDRRMDQYLLGGDTSLPEYQYRRDSFLLTH